MIAASAIFVILITAIIIWKMRYEVFYITHITMYMLILINVGFHRPEFALKTIVITISAASMWSSDRILRLCRILWYSYDNRAKQSLLCRMVEQESSYIDRLIAQLQVHIALSGFQGLGQPKRTLLRSSQRHRILWSLWLPHTMASQKTFTNTRCNIPGHVFEHQLMDLMARSQTSPRMQTK